MFIRSLSKNLSLEDLRELERRIPYQKIHDSPTLKFYTNWSIYDRYIFSEDDLYKDLYVKSLGDLYERATADIYYLGSKVEILSNKNSHIDVRYYPRKEILEGSVREFFNIPDLFESKMILRHLLDISSGLYIDIKDSSKDLLKIYVGGSFKNSHLSQHIYIRIRDGVKSKILFIVDAPEDGMRTLFNEFNLENNAEATIGFVMFGGSASYNRNYLSLDKGSSVRFFTVIFGGEASTLINSYYLNGERSSVFSRSFTLSRGDEWIHNAEQAFLENIDTESRIFMRGVAYDDSKNIMRGYAKQNKDARRSKASVDVQGINLGGRSLLVTAPFIEVLSGDVDEASHSASQYTLDLDAEFYLRSRGLDKDNATKILLKDYVEDYISGVDEDLQKVFREYLANSFTS
jgi:Fe-S cluster assembly scaffold protein SufB